MSEYITTEAVEPVSGIIIKPGEVLKLRCYSTAGSIDVRINATRADLMEVAPIGEAADVGATYGQEIIDDGLIEGRLIAGTFANMCKFTNALQLGSIAAAGYTEFEIKTTLSAGIAAFGLCVRALK